ncbi:neuromedin-S [Denticeps clupeoides]|uniref:neuromedin-S n=1 Tax=Denticeps clupeoides TaxID=299321 RepID=UPI0010A4B45F|nr:neuromedin-S [Denticeps clupeoides]
MGSPTWRQVFFPHLFLWCLAGLSFSTVAYQVQVPDCKNGEAVKEDLAEHSSSCALSWRDQNTDQIQNVFKRFLFHYSKAQNSMGSVQRESHSVHPLMRLSPSLSQRRKKQLLLTKYLLPLMGAE